MLPSQLKPEQFQAYSPLARELAMKHLPLLQQLPEAFDPFLLKEIITLDSKFPSERDEITAQLTYLESLPIPKRDQELATFDNLQLSPELQQFNWVNRPQQYLEKLSAHLWATHQINKFRAASEDYINHFYTAMPAPAPASHRFAAVLVGNGVSKTDYRLFRKLRRQGTYYSKVMPKNGLATILETAEARANAHASQFAHWYIDGGRAATNSGSTLTTLSYDGLSGVRSAINTRMHRAYDAHLQSEAFRTMLAQMTPAELGLHGTGGEAVMQAFAVSLLTEGSGTQVFSTTFVQWAAREALRRARPLTLVARFTPRLRERPMNELLSAPPESREVDPEGSLIDADMGAWYTWLNLQRLTGFDQSTFLVWFEDHSEAVAIGPKIARGAHEATPIELQELLRELA
jgi:hypothetical protein